MSKERNKNYSNTVIMFHGDVTEYDLKSIPDDFDGDIIVSGDVIIHSKNFNIPYSLWIYGALFSEYSINIIGDVFCSSTINIFLGGIRVLGDLYCGHGVAATEQINVGGTFLAKSSIFATVINVGGDFFYKANKVWANEINVLGEQGLAVFELN